MVAVAESLQRALEHHEAGQLEQAEALYREIIRVDPSHVDALHLLGVASLQRADHRAAADYILQAIAKGGESALYHSNLGACYRSMHRIPDAIASFREAVRLEPEFVGARYNLAMALEAAGRAAEAVDEYREVLRQDAGFIAALNNLGSLLASQDRCDEAVDCFRRAIAIHGGSARFHYNLANVLAQSHRCDEAVVEYRESIRLDPQIPEAYNNLGTALNELGRRDEALAALQKSLELRPDYAEAQLNLATVEQAQRQDAERSRLGGVPRLAPAAKPSLPVGSSSAEFCRQASALQNEGRCDEAAELFQQALALDPNCAAAYFGLGYALLSSGKQEQACSYYEQALLIDDTNAAAWNNLGSIYTSLEQWDEAVACYESALQIEPANAKAHYNLGNVHKDRLHLSDAAACYRRALYVEPTLAEAHINLGVVLQQQGRLEEAAASHTRAITIRPNDAEAHFHRSLTWLLKGDFEQGWDEYEWRWLYEASPREFPFPAWDGGDLAGKTVLVYAEQGVGDEIMFASCMPDVLERASRCLIECDPRLVPLFARSFPLAEVVGRPVSIECAAACGIDVQIAMGSLPRILRRGRDAFPRRLRYLAACPVKQAQWSDRYARLGPGLKVGISWRGGTKAVVKRRRSTLLEQWAPLLSLPGVHFVNLQYGDCTADLDAIETSLGVVVHDWPDANPLKDLDGFAAQVAELDLVVSVDNATVHMAGALGVPVWTLLHFAPNWRWLLRTDSSAWYPQMHLMRQPESGEWDAVFIDAAERLRSLAKMRTSKTASERSALAPRPGVPPQPIAAPAAADPQAEKERAKYERIWAFNEYRRFSPGAVALDQVPLIAELRKLGVRTILDAGCGSGKMMWRLMTEYAAEFEVHGFDITDNCLDPCFNEIKSRVLTTGCLWNPGDFTKVYDAVICTDVMEHIPTDRVPAVLANLRKSASRFAYFSIAVVPDAFGPKLIDEPLHLTVQKPNWWFAKFALAGFKITSHAVAETRDGTESQLHIFATV